MGKYMFLRMTQMRQNFKYQSIAQEMIDSFEVLGLSDTNTTIEGAGTTRTNLVNTTFGDITVYLTGLQPI
jgi:hypothetical protein